MAAVVPVLPDAVGVYVRDIWMPSSAVARLASPCARSWGDRFWKALIELRPAPVTVADGEPVVMSGQTIATLALTPGRVTVVSAGSTDAARLSCATREPGAAPKLTATMPAAEAAPPDSSPGLV